MAEFVSIFLNFKEKGKDRAKCDFPSGAENKTLTIKNIVCEAFYRCFVSQML